MLGVGACACNVAGVVSAVEGQTVACCRMPEQRNSAPVRSRMGTCEVLSLVLCVVREAECAGSVCVLGSMLSTGLVAGWRVTTDQ